MTEGAIRFNFEHLTNLLTKSEIEFTFKDNVLHSKLENKNLNKSLEIVVYVEDNLMIAKVSGIESESYVDKNAGMAVFKFIRAKERHFSLHSIN